MYAVQSLSCLDHSNHNASAVRINIQPTVILLSTRLDETVDAVLQTGRESTDLHSNEGWSLDIS